MQPYFLPYVGYWQLMAKVDEWIIFDDVQFIDKGWINRNRISHPNGKDDNFWLTIPLSGRKQFSLIRDVKINNDVAWRKSFVGKFATLKRESEYYTDALELFERIVEVEHVWLIDHVIHSINIIRNYLEIDNTLSVQSKDYSDVSSSLGLAAGDWALKLAVASKSNIYINPISGADIFEESKFNSHNIELKYFVADVLPPIENSGKEYWQMSIVEAIARFGPNLVKEKIKLGTIRKV